MKISADKLRLYAVTDSAWLNGRSLAEVVREAIEGGATVVQYREKNKGYDDMLKDAREVCAVCRAYGVPFIMNDSVELAMAVDADGVHLGLDDGELKAARARISFAAARMSFCANIALTTAAPARLQPFSMDILSRFIPPMATTGI